MLCTLSPNVHFIILYVLTITLFTIRQHFVGKIYHSEIRLSIVNCINITLGSRVKPYRNEFRYWSPSGQYCVGVHLDVSGIHCTSALTILKWLFVIYSVSVDHRLLFVCTYYNTGSSQIVRLILCSDHRKNFFIIFIGIVGSVLYEF